MLDEQHPDLPNSWGDSNTYALGQIRSHNIVIACLLSGIYGTSTAAIVVAHMRLSYPSIQVGLMVGIGGGVPTMQSDIRLGDVVVSRPTRDSGGVIQYDYGKTIGAGQFQLTGSLNKPPYAILTTMSVLQARYQLNQGAVQPILEQSSRKHAIDSTIVARQPRDSNAPHIHYGLIASGNQVMKQGATRDKFARQFGFLCFEMEAAGVLDHLPCVVIRGVCDYADSHKNKQWQAYAAMTAAAYTKELLTVMLDDELYRRTFVVDAIRNSFENRDGPTIFHIANLTHQTPCHGLHRIKEMIRTFFGPDRTTPDFDDLCAVFSNLAHTSSGATFILDGLDNLAEEDTRKLLKTLHSLLHLNHISARVLLFSRNYVSGNLDIASILSGTIHEGNLYRKLTDNAEVLGEMRRQLLTKSSEMFLWVYPQLEIIWDTCATDAEVRSALDHLPKSLEETYNRCFQRINLDDAHTVSVLKLVSFAARPLFVDELREAITFGVGDDKWEPDKMPWKTFVIACGAYLIIEDPVDASIRFAHPSIRQYLHEKCSMLASWPQTIQCGQLEYGEICLSYLSLPDLSLNLESSHWASVTAKIPDPEALAREATVSSAVGRLLSWRVKNKPLASIQDPLAIQPKGASKGTKYKFLEYAAANWALHTKEITPKSPVWDRFCQIALTFNETWNFHPWISGGHLIASQIHGLFGWVVRQQHGPLLDIALNSGAEILSHNTSALALFEMAFERVDEIEKISVDDLRALERAFGVSTLYEAAHRGNAMLINLFIRKGANVNRLAAQGYVEIVTSPIKAGASLEIRDEEADTALSRAIAKGGGAGAAVVKVLLENGANLESRNGLGQTALSLAASEGNLSMVEFLVEKGADLNSVDDGGRTPLYWAAHYNHEPVRR
ncbi:hypothetical protein BJX70DRAFT_386565 [Aspergillus crustosus]